MFLRRTLLTLALVGLVASTSFAEYAYLRIHPTLRPYLISFYEDCRKHSADCPRLEDINLTMDYVVTHPELADKTRGLCSHVWEPFTGLRRRIIIRYIPNELPIELKATVYHELLHCLLYKSHPTEEDTSSWPLEERPFSLLDPYHRADLEFYEQNWDALVEADLRNTP